MSPKPFILLPPSEAKAGGGLRVARVGLFDGPLASPRRVLLAALHDHFRDATVADLERTLKVRGVLFERAMHAMTALVEGDGRQRPAWKRYNGVVWHHLEPESLDPSQRRRILVPSGLYGIATGTDPIADYRLRMDASVVPLGLLSTYWRPFVTAALRDHVGPATVIDLLPSQHASVLDHNLLGGSTRVVRVKFVAASGSGAAGHDAKAVKGVLARTLLRDGLDALDEFSWEGWRARRGDAGHEIVAPHETAGPRGR